VVAFIDVIHVPGALFDFTFFNPAIFNVSLPSLFFLQLSVAGHQNEAHTAKPFSLMLHLK
jgi:hypothetical protein